MSPLSNLRGYVVTLDDKPVASLLDEGSEA